MSKKWKQMWTSVLAIALAASLAACGGTTSDITKESNNPSASAPYSVQPTDEDEAPMETEQEQEIKQETIEGRTKTAIEMLEVWDGSVAESFDGGDGSAENPYQIANAAQLAKLASDTNSGIDFSSKYFQLSADIMLNDISAWNFQLSAEENITACTSLSGWTSWTPIGLNYGFNGSFDGNNHIIYGLSNGGTYYSNLSHTISGSVGLFGQLGGNISNLIIACGWLAPGAENAGVIAGCADEGNISNSHILQMWVRPSVAENIGGICGDFVRNDMCLVSNCSSEAVITYRNNETKNVNIGGIVGSACCYDDDGTIIGCYNASDIVIYTEITDSDSYRLPGIVVGGICGNGDIIKSCHNVGGVTIEAYNKLGQESKDTPFVRAGGIAGTCYAAIENCSSVGNIAYGGDITSLDTGAGAYLSGIAGLLGKAQAQGSTGRLKKVDVAFCYSDTKIDTGDSESNIGGIAGSVCGEITVTNCYYNKEYSGKAVAHTVPQSTVFTDQIKGLSNDELCESSNYYNWDFDFTWMINEGLNKGLPMLRSLIEYY